MHVVEEDDDNLVEDIDLTKPWLIGKNRIRIERDLEKIQYSCLFFDLTLPPFIHLSFQGDATFDL